METMFPIFLFVGIMVATIISENSHERQIQDMVKRWAVQSGFQLISREQPWFRTGPYWLKSKSQRIYRVVVADRNGRQRCAWLRCSNTFWSGERLEVEWEN